MKISLRLLICFFLNPFLAVKAQKNLNAQDYVTVTMDMQGVLELNMSTDPQVDFVFNTVQKYQTGITKNNATILKINSTVPWDLYVQPASQYWTQNMAYGSNAGGQNQLPSEILELQCSRINNAPDALNFNSFSGLFSNFGSNTAASSPTNATQFLSGYFGTAAGIQTRMANETTNLSAMNDQLAIHYRIRPGLPAVFPNLSKEYPAVAKSCFPEHSFVQPGYYQLEIVYSLVEDL